uniref:Uncharacterized protein n=1 Tax=Arcella intermedia TaxID=1963864 RepID=A0A6B2LG04_9EUKA
MDLHRNPITEKVVIEISKALQANCTLQKLNLSECEINSACAGHLSGALRVNTTLNVLDISGNKLGPEGAEYLAMALKTNTTLLQLKISCTFIQEKGAQLLSEALQVNSRLLSLYMKGNSINRLVFLQSICKNYSLISLKIHDQLKDKEDSNLKAYLYRNVGCRRDRRELLSPDDQDTLLQMKQLFTMLSLPSDVTNNLIYYILQLTIQSPNFHPTISFFKTQITIQNLCNHQNT